MGSVYKIVELVGTSDSSWEEEAATAVATAGHSLRDLRIAHVTDLDLQIADDGSIGGVSRQGQAFVQARRRRLAGTRMVAGDPAHRPPTTAAEDVRVRNRLGEQ